jgi:Fe2+ or Zn2+ uptake regulation protein
MLEEKLAQEERQCTSCGKIISWDDTYQLANELQHEHDNLIPTASVEVCGDCFRFIMVE